MKSWLVILCVLMLGTGCKLRLRSATETVTKVETIHTYTEKYRDTTIYLPGENVVTGLDSAGYAAINAALRQAQGTGRDTVIFKSYNNGVAMKFYQDAFGRLQVECEKKDQAVQALIKTINEQSAKKTKVEGTVIINRVPNWCRWLLVLSILFNFLGVVWFVLKVLK
jgi:hypothetical protein